MEIVKLKNGTEEAMPLVAVTWMALKSLLDQPPEQAAAGGIAFYELVMLCRDRDHKIFGNAGDLLKQAHLIEPDCSVHTSIKNIVLSASEGEGLQMKLVDPRAEGGISMEGFPVLSREYSERSEEAT